MRELVCPVEHINEKYLWKWQNKITIKLQWKYYKSHLRV